MQLFPASFRIAALAVSLLTLAGAAETARAVASNDACANATALSGTSTTATGDNTGATLEQFEDQQNGNATLWYTWTAPQDGDVTLTVTNANGANKFAHVLSAYLGNGIQSINLINSARGGKSTDQFDTLATLVFPAKQGLSYRICFGSLNNSTGAAFQGPFSFTLSQATQSPGWSYGPAMPSSLTPSNDACDNAVAMTGASLNIVGYNASATVEVGEGAPHPNGNFTVWYKWTAQQDGDVTLTVTNANYDYIFSHQLTVYLGDTIAHQNLINSARGGKSQDQFNTPAKLKFPAKNGLTYLICFGSINNSPGNAFAGPFSFTLQQASQDTPYAYGPAMPTSTTPSNDACDNAVAMTGASLNVVGYNPDATVEVGEGNSHPNGNFTVWYAWTAQQDGDVTLTMKNANYDYAFAHQITVYLGGSVQSLNLINSARGGTSVNQTNTLAAVTFPAKTGLTYRICIGSINNANGNAFSGPFSFILQQTQQSVPWSFAPAMPTGNTPSNDDCVNAVQMTGTLLNVVGYNASATVEVGETSQRPNGNNTIWYAWTAHQDGDVFLQITNANYDYKFAHKITVYLGGNIQALNLVNAAEGGKSVNFLDAAATLRFPAKSGLTYCIALGSINNAVGNAFSGPISFTLTQGSQLSPWDFGAAMPTTNAPTNDGFANPVVMTGLPINVVGYNSSASTEIGEPTVDHSNSLWYAWTAPSTGSVIMAVTDANGPAKFPHQIIAYQGQSLQTLHLLAGAVGGKNVAAHDAPAAIKLNVTAGVVYRICFSSLGNGSPSTSSGPFSFSIFKPNGAKPFVTEAGTYQGIIGDSAGLLTVNVTSSGAFTGQLLLNGKTTSLHGTFDSNGSYFGPPANPVFSFSLIRAGNTYAITGAADGQNIEIFKSASASGGATLAESGKYTLLLSPTTADAGVPQGIGYGVLTIGKTGKGRLVGRLADNTSFTVSGPILTQSGGADEFNIFTRAIYHKKGLLSGVISFAGSANEDCSATLLWMKPTSSSHYYGGGINTELDLKGSAYHFTKGTMALAFASSPGNASITVKDGGLGATGLSETIDYTGTNTIIVSSATIPGLRVKISTSSGLFSGSFVDPQGQKKTAFSGALFTKVPQAAGYFLGPVTSGIGLSGSVDIH